MSETELRAVSEVITRAKTPEDLFGILVGDQQAGLKAQYRRLMDAVHPDKFASQPDLWKVANAAFIQATTRLREAEERIRAGIYGDVSKVLTPKVTDPNPPPKDLVIDGVKLHLERVYAQGDLCDLYACSYTPKPEPIKEKPAEFASSWDALMEPEEMPPKPISGALFKVVRAPADNDLLNNEAKVLRQIYPPGQAEERYFRYLPKLYTSTVYVGVGGRRTVNIFARYDGFFPASDVIGVYPQGLDYRDAIWMYKRMLVGLGYVHLKGFIHGAILPTHIIVDPVGHGARIVGWSYAVERNGTSFVRALSKPYREFYAPEIPAKRVPTPATDIYMATKVMVALLGGNVQTGQIPDKVPEPLRRFFAGCLIANPSSRPNDAWALHDELAGILENVVGKPKYRPLKMPPGAKA